MPGLEMGRVDRFLSDFLSQLDSRVRPKIGFILLGGSAARGDFQAGRSDLDLIIFVKEDRDVQAVKDAAFPLFYELDRKHAMHLKEAMDRKLSERLIYADKPPPGKYPPFLVVGPSTPKMGSGTLFSRLDMVHGFSKSLARSGRMSMKLVYGKLPEGEGPLSAKGAEGPGLITYDFLAALLMAPLSIICPARAYARSMRAVFFSFEAEIAAGATLPMFVRRALYARKYIRETISGASYPEKVLFCIEAPLRILLRNISRPPAGKS